MDKPKPVPLHAKATHGLLMRKTRYSILDVTGEVIRTGDITDYPNANTQATLQFVVEQQCDMMHWHRQVSLSIPPYDYTVLGG